MITLSKIIRLAFVGLFALTAGLHAEDAVVNLRVDPSTVLSRISEDFIGFGYESSAVAQSNFFCASNFVMTRLYRNLSPHGLIRVGGNVSDHTRYVRNGVAVPKTEREVTLLNEGSLRNLGDFARGAGWKVMWGLNLGSGSKAEAVEEAQAVDAALGDRLQSFEIGNEVDALRRFDRKYDAYYSAFADDKAAIRAALPGAKFSGPDVIGNWMWITNFVIAESSDMQLLTQHYYRGGAGNPASTLEKLLQRDENWERRLGKLRQLCQSYKIAYRINEVNSYSGGGKAGVSDTFGSALWVLDFMFKVASFGGEGVNIETDVNQLGFISHYSPIVHDPSGLCHVRPEYYGMLAFAMAGHGQLVDVTTGKTAINLSTYATKDDSGQVWIIAVNKDFSRSADLRIGLPKGCRGADIFRLTAPAMQSKDHVSFAGAEVSEDGTWSPGPPEQKSAKAGTLPLSLPAASAVVIKLRPE